MTPDQFSLVILTVTILYFIFSGIIIHRRPELIWLPALLVLAAGTALYWGAYADAGAQQPLSRLVLAVTAAAEMFLFRYNTTYGRFTEFFYLLRSAGGSFISNVSVENHLLAGVGVFLCAGWTTGILAVHFFARRLISRLSLVGRRIRRPSAGIHLFIGISAESIAVAKSIRDKRNVIFVDVPVKDAVPERVSLHLLFRDLRSNSDLGDKVSSEIPKALVLKAKKPLSRCVGDNLFKELGLSRLQHWARMPQTSVYLLSERYPENLSALPKLSSYPAKLYIHAKRENLSFYTELASSGNVHIVDSSYLCSHALKLREDLYPIRVVEVARDAQGQPAGYVRSSFQALICGFGEGGQGALSFLYEFGAFPGKNKKQSPFLCSVIDGDMDAIRGAYWTAHPGMDRKKVQLLGDRFGSESFWIFAEKNIDSLNYVYISMGDDELNIRSAIDMMMFAFRNRKNLDRFMIVVQLDNPGAYAPLLKYYNDNIGNGTCLKTIGDIGEVWTLRNISGEDIADYARRFYSSYARATGDVASWEERNARISSRKGASDYSKKMEIIRKTSQDFANYFHARVKAALMPARFWEDEPVSASILPAEKGGKHSTFEDKAVVDVLDYLAVGEHLRWRTSHEAAGYRKGPVKSEDAMTHTDLCPYEDLSETVKHYDWLVVKTTLELLRGE